MLDPQQLLQQFVAEYGRDPAADPRAYLARADEADRAELAALIDRFLLGVPRRIWDPRAFEGSLAKRAVAAAAEADAASSAAWPELLPELRDEAQLTRRTVVERLALALGAADRQERVGSYYHRMERGQLAPAGVSDRVLTALAGILGSTTEALRRAGEAAGGSEGPGGEIFARLGRPSELRPSRSSDAEPARDVDAADPPDDLDRLFLGDG
jgi:hypothetical protein